MSVAEAPIAPPAVPVTQSAPQESSKPTARRYHLISADSHVNEPGDLWTSRVPAAYRDRVPRIESFEQGDAFVYEGMDAPMPFGLNACGGMGPEHRKSWMRWEQVRAGGYDPAVRIQEMDLDQVDGEVLFPSPRLWSAIFAHPDRDLHLVMVQAYNDWLLDFAGYDPSRLRAVPVIPNAGVAQALAEIERIGDRPGIGGLLMGQYPTGGIMPTRENDPVWEALVERDLTLNIHVSLSPGMPKSEGSPGPLPGAGRHIPIAGQLLELIFSGVFDRFPSLQVVAAEVDCGWVPYYKEQIDDNFRRFRHNYTMDRFPSEYLESNVSFSFVTDSYGVDNRHRIGVDRIMWSTDYPHPSTSWPNSWNGVNAMVSGIPMDERDKILFGNAVRLYRFDR
jgi:predicted TIM-barrel fold metal-dependent hydrolase